MPFARRYSACAGFKQPLDQRECLVANAGGLVGGAELEIAQIDRSPERRLAVPIHRVDVRAGIEQEVGHRQVIASPCAAHAKDAGIDDGADERRDAVAVGALQRGTALDEQTCDVEMPLARGIQQRGFRAARGKAFTAVFGPARADDADAAR